MPDQCLMRKFEWLKTEYVKAVKSKLLEIARKIGEQMLEVAKQLKAEGYKNDDLGLSNDGEYVVRSIEMVAQNPTSPNADAILADAKRLRCESCGGKCQSTGNLFTIRGFEKFPISLDGQISLPEPEPIQPQPKQSSHLPTRNTNIETPPNRVTLRRNGTQVGEKGFLNLQESE